MNGEGGGGGGGGEEVGVRNVEILMQVMGSPATPWSVNIHLFRLKYYASTRLVRAASC